MTPNKNKKCSETYDLTFKGAIRGNSSVTVPSTVSAFSICAWIKFPVYKNEYFKKEYGVLGYTPTYLSNIALSRLAVKYETEGVPTLMFRYYHWYDVFLTSSSHIKLDAVQSGISNEWNFVCITRESSSGNTHLFLHGKKSVTANKLMFPGQTLRKGGNISLAGRTRRTLTSFRTLEPTATENLPLTISQVNVWDRKLQMRLLLCLDDKRVMEELGMFLIGKISKISWFSVNLLKLTNRNVLPCLDRRSKLPTHLLWTLN